MTQKYDVENRFGNLFFLISFYSTFSLGVLVCTRLYAKTFQINLSELFHAFTLRTEEGEELIERRKKLVETSIIFRFFSVKWKKTLSEMRHTYTRCTVKTWMAQNKVKEYPNVHSKCCFLPPYLFPRSPSDIKHCLQSNGPNNLHFFALCPYYQMNETLASEKVTVSHCNL